jgi:hypothetical protein
LNEDDFAPAVKSHIQEHDISVTAGRQQITAPMAEKELDIWSVIRDALRTYLIFIPVILIPLAGIVAYLTVVQFAAGLSVGKHFRKKEYLPGCAIGFLFGLVVTMLLFIVFSLLAAVVFFSLFEATVVMLLIAACTVFTGAGCFTASGK